MPYIQNAATDSYYTLSGIAFMAPGAVIWVPQSLYDNSAVIAAALIAGEIIDYEGVGAPQPDAIPHQFETEFQMSIRSGATATSLQLQFLESLGGFEDNDGNLYDAGDTFITFRVELIDDNGNYLLWEGLQGEDPGDGSITLTLTNNENFKSGQSYPGTLGSGVGEYNLTDAVRDNFIVTADGGGAYQQVITVAKSGGMFTTIQAAIDSANPIVHSGTAQAGAAATITLAATASAVDDYYNGMKVRLTGGTGSGQIRTIIDYVGSTKVATVDSNWSVNPDVTTTYAVKSIITVSVYPGEYDEAITLKDCVDVIAVDPKATKILPIQVISHKVIITEYNVDISGINDSFAGIEDAIADLAGSGDLYFPKGTYRIASNLTGASGIRFVFEHGAMISVDTAKTWTANGPVQYTPGQQIFTGAGSLIWNNGQPIHAECFGVDGDSDNVEVTKALASLPTGGELCLLGKTYYIAAAITVPISTTLGNITIRGQGRKTRFEIASGQKAFYAAGKTTGGIGNYDSTARSAGLKISEIFFDSATWATRGTYGIHIEGVLQSIIENCWFRYLTYGVYAKSLPAIGDGLWELLITKNNFDCCTRPIHLLNAHDSIVSNNTMEGFSQAAEAAGITTFDDIVPSAGIYMEGGFNGSIVNNAIESQPDVSGTNYGIHIYNHSYNIEISGNSMESAATYIDHDLVARACVSRIFGNNTSLKINTDGAVTLTANIFGHTGTIILQGTGGTVSLFVDGGSTLSTTATLSLLNCQLSNLGNINFTSGTITTANIGIEKAGSLQFGNDFVAGTLTLNARDVLETDFLGTINGGSINLDGVVGSQVNIESATLSYCRLSRLTLSGGILIQQASSITKFILENSVIGGYVRVTGAGTEIEQAILTGNTFAGAIANMIQADGGGVVTESVVTNNKCTGGTPYAVGSEVAIGISQNNINAKERREVVAGTATYLANGYEGVIQVSTSVGQACTITLPAMTTVLIGRKLTIGFATDGGQDVTITRGGSDVIDEVGDLGNVSITLDNVNDCIVLEATTMGHWLVIKNIGCVLA